MMTDRERQAYIYSKTALCVRVLYTTVHRGLMRSRALAQWHASSSSSSISNSVVLAAR
jgi:hypothetical protein